MPFLISIPLFAVLCAAALRGLVALLNRERGIFDASQNYRPVSEQPGREGQKMPWDLCSGRKGRAHRTFTLP